MMDALESVDVTDEGRNRGLLGWAGVIRADRQGANTLILTRMENPVKRFDGKKAAYRLEYRWHPSPDSDLTEVRGREFSYWQGREIPGAVGGREDLFEHFQLF